LARVTLELEMRDLNTGGTVLDASLQRMMSQSAEKMCPQWSRRLIGNVQRAVAEVIASLDQYFAAHPVK